MKLLPQHLPSARGELDRTPADNLTARLLGQAPASERQDQSNPIETPDRVLVNPDTLPPVVGKNDSPPALPLAQDEPEPPKSHDTTTAQQEPEPDQPRTAVAVAMHWLTEALAAGPRAGGELAKAAASSAGIKSRTLYRAAQRLCIQRQDGLWSLPLAAALDQPGTLPGSAEGDPQAAEPPPAPTEQPATLAETTTTAAKAPTPSQGTPKTENGSEGLTDALDALAFAADALSKAARLVRRHAARTEV